MRAIERTRSAFGIILILGALASSACFQEVIAEAGDDAGVAEISQPLAAAQPTTVPFEKLPRLESIESTEVFIQQLNERTELGENAVIHVKLPEPSNTKLKESLVRVLGTEADPIVLFRSDALARLGRIEAAPGPEFFSAFVDFDPAQLDQRVRNTDVLASGRFGQTTELTVIFEGRSPVGIRSGLKVNVDDFRLGRRIPLGACFLRPISNLKNWGESLMITAKNVVLDSARTWDPCTGAGTKGGKWTFAHLIRELAAGSGTTAEKLVLAWLSKWLNNYTLNGDLVARRLEMFNQVIRPWAIASGIPAPTLTTTSGGTSTVNLNGGSLNLNIAPFRLLAIVNRIDLGRTVSGPGGYGGGVTERPADAGELRFVFGVVQPNPWGAGTQGTCGLKPFTVIFEYGVPIEGCSHVVKWARRWTALNAAGGFTASYLTQLEGLTESVVKSGAAPTKGNQSALNQIRTNENALSSRWELREFTLTLETPSAGTDVPINGLLRQHTVAQTPNDAAFPTPHATVDHFVKNNVTCGAPYEVPFSYLGKAFRGGNSLVPTIPKGWLVTPPVDVCSRHEFSLNTCDGCHRVDTATAFTHVNPLSGIPAALSGFLTGGGPGLAFSVPDSQFGAPNWPFADLHRRFDRLYDIAFCTECSRLFPIDPKFLEAILEIARVLPIDPRGPVSIKAEIGAITDLRVVAKLLDVRPQFRTTLPGVDMEVDIARKAESFVH